jgi:multidrug efflux pump
MTAQLDQGLKVLEKAAGEILPPGYTINYTGESRQLRTEGGKYLPALGLAIVMIFLVLAVQFNSFRDPFVVLLGSVPLAKQHRVERVESIAAAQREPVESLEAATVGVA